MKGAVFRAAARAALRSEGRLLVTTEERQKFTIPTNFSPCAEDRKITLKDLIEAAQDEVGKATTRMGFRRQDSDAARMFNWG